MGISGVIFQIKASGKGSYQIYIMERGVPKTFYLLGLGEKKDDILVSDSIVKNSNDKTYYFYRIINGKYRLVYSRDI